MLTHEHHTLTPYKMAAAHSAPFFAAAGLAAARVNCRGEIGRNPTARFSIKWGWRDRTRTLEIKGPEAGVHAMCISRYGHANGRRPVVAPYLGGGGGRPVWWSNAASQRSHPGGSVSLSSMKASVRPRRG